MHKLLFIGDSITDAGRNSQNHPLGIGYVRVFADLMAVRQPSRRLAIVNRGIGGNTIVDLRNRWTDHMLAHRPDQLVVKIGINDCTQMHRDPANVGILGPEAFAKNYHDLMTLTREELPDVRILLLSPFYASPDARPDSNRGRMAAKIPEYVAAVRETAARHKLEFLDLHAAVQNLIREMPPDAFAEDAIHPTSAGILFIAEQVYAALE